MNSAFTFTLSRDEYVQMQWDLMKKLVLVVSVIVGLAGVLIGAADGDIAVLLGGLAGGPIAYVVLRQALRATYARQWTASEGLKGEWKVTLDDEGVHHENVDGRSMVKWRAIDRVRVTPWLWLFRLKTNMWLFVPRRAFGGIREERAVKKRIEAYGVEVLDSGRSAWT